MVKTSACVEKLNFSSDGFAFVSAQVYIFWHRYHIHYCTSLAVILQYTKLYKKKISFLFKNCADFAYFPSRYKYCKKFFVLEVNFHFHIVLH